MVVANSHVIVTCTTVSETVLEGTWLGDSSQVYAELGETISGKNS